MARRPPPSLATRDTSVALVVQLTSSDTTEATVPATVTIPANATSVSFDIDAVDDPIMDGTQTVTITASQEDHDDGADTVDVTDDDVAQLTLSIDPVSFSEGAGDGAAVGTVTRNSDAGALVVQLASDDISEATVPATVTILDGQTSATFEINAVDDAIVDGSQTVNITATADGPFQRCG